MDVTETHGLTNEAFEGGVGAWEFDEIDTVAARSQEEAMTFYQQETGFGDNEMAEHEVRQITNLDAAKMHTDEDYDSPLITFREGIRRLEQVPDLLASTEY